MRARLWIGAALWGAAIISAVAVGCTTNKPVTQPPATTSTAPTATTQVKTDPCEGVRIEEALRTADLVADASVRTAIGDSRRRGPVVVRHKVDGCKAELEVLPRCKAAGYYGYRQYSATESKLIHNRQELLTELPVGASKVAGKLAGGKALRADLVLVGTLSSPADARWHKQDLTGDGCKGATHVVSKIYLGGFAMAVGNAEALERNATIFGKPLPSVIAREGHSEACAKAPEKRYPVELCSVPLRIALTALSEKPAAPKSGKCAHDICEAGPGLAADCDPCVTKVCAADDYCCKSRWDTGCVNKAKNVCKLSCGPGGAAAACTHDKCTKGKALVSGCDPCETKVCAKDKYCCKSSWDVTCLKKVKSECGVTCPGLPPPKPKYPPASCNHDKCTKGGPLKASCDSCTAKICAADKYCCSKKWDTGCVNKVKSKCKFICPCEKYGKKGKCEGHTLKYCSFGTVKTYDCKKRNKRCGYHPQKKLFMCLPRRKIVKPPPGSSGQPG